MKLLVCGGRHYSESGWVTAHLDAIRREHPALEIGCGYDPNDVRNQGADQYAYEWAKLRGIPGRCYPAHWNDLTAPGAQVVNPKFGRPYNKLAGPQRNQRMLDTFKPDRVLSFPDDPMGPGTAHMCNIARRAGVPVHVVTLKATDDEHRCVYETPYYGRCRRPNEVGDHCLEHATQTCGGCGAPATHGCSDWVGSFVCCFPLCDNCEGDHKAASWPDHPAHHPKVAQP